MFKRANSVDVLMCVTICLLVTIINNLICLILQVVQYNHHPQERRPHDLNWVDTSVKAELNRISVKLSAAFLANMLVSHFIGWCSYEYCSYP